MNKSYKITINGTVQGVGFRPFIYRIATQYNLDGTVSNGANGVEIVVNSSEEIVTKFIETIRRDSPPLSSIDTIDIVRVAYQNFEAFTIIKSENRGDIVVNIPPDISICKECESELFDPQNRRFAYPFITCTNCGVRYSIIYDLPYDRVNTSMKFFKMCKLCEEEYSDLRDRRYHAQPIGCWECGVLLELYSKSQKLQIEQRDILTKAVQLLQEGNILAIKGVGGYHLICKASDSTAIERLRKKKGRVAKPFAIMVKDISMAKQLASINAQEERVLSSKERPIVLLKAKRDTAMVAMHTIAPNITKIGLFLPYTPLNHLLLDMLDAPIVATSANITDEPIATDSRSVQKLSGVYDYLLDHNRAIVNGCDDSVVMVVKGQKVTLRRARGYAPMSIKLPFHLKEKRVALGANQKSTIAIGFDDQVILSPHIGDLDTTESVEYFKTNIENLKRMYRFEPTLIAHDKHPNYESTKLASQLQAEDSSLHRKAVGHHYAHILAVMAEKKIEEKVLGVAFDGTGYGDDGKLWGGEFIVCDYENYERVAHIEYFRLLGGSKAIKEPKRVALSLLFDLYQERAMQLDSPTIRAFSSAQLQTHYTMWKKALNAPLSSSVGRLFDAVASLCGICQEMSYEGESGLLMEEYYDSSVVEVYPYSIRDKKIDILPMIELLHQDTPAIAISKFFNTLVDIISHMQKQYQLPLLVSGGVFQNRVLLELLLEKIPDVIIPNEIPPNDGGIALGQIVSQ